MVKLSSPSDYTAVNPNYAIGQGYYTNEDKIADLLQIPSFTASTNPSYDQVGSIIKGVEDKIDEKTGMSFRPIIYANEMHNFRSPTGGSLRKWPSWWSDYVGFCPLNHRHIRKMIRIEVWQGNRWTDLASATAIVSVTSAQTGSSGSITLTLPDNTTFVLNKGTTNAQYNNKYGPKTIAQEICHVINETYPANTARFTGASASKAVVGSDGSNVSDFFYATVNTEDETEVVISSLLPGDDGSQCSIAVSGSGLSKEDFTDNEEMRRLGTWWRIDEEGRIFFRTKFPYMEKNSIRMTYIAGNPRVPGIISSAATKLAACEILRHDDQTVLIAESGSQIDIKTKYDLLKQEAEDLLKLTKETIFLIE